MARLGTITSLALSVFGGSLAEVAQQGPTYVLVSPPESASIKAFHVGQTEATWAQYLLAVEAASCPLPTNQSNRPIPNGAALSDDYAVTGLTPPAVRCYIRCISKTDGHQYRLLSPEEWLYLAKRAYIAAGSADTGKIGRPIAVDEPREGVRGGVVLPATHGGVSPDGLYGLLDSAGEMVDQTEPASPRTCALHGVQSCNRQIVYGMSVGFTKTPYFEKEWVLNTSTNRYVGFRLAYDH